MVPRRGTRRDINLSNKAICIRALRALFIVLDKNVVTFVVTLAFSRGHPAIKGRGPETPVADTDGSAEAIKSWI